MAQDAFEALGLPPSFDLTPSEVRRAWLARTAQLHPDRLSAAPAAAPIPADEAARASALVNEARLTLENPERRAEALLARLGGPSKERDKSLPPDALAEVLDIRERMEESRRQGASMDQFHRWAEDRRAQHIQRIDALFSAIPPAPAQPDPAPLRAIRLELNAWRYIERMIEQLDPDYQAPQS